MVIVSGAVYTQESTVAQLNVQVGVSVNLSYELIPSETSTTSYVTASILLNHEISNSRRVSTKASVESSYEAVTLYP